jgi:hypothetical protein
MDVVRHPARSQHRRATLTHRSKSSKSRPRRRSPSAARASNQGGRRERVALCPW